MMPTRIWTKQKPNKYLETWALGFLGFTVSPTHLSVLPPTSEPPSLWGLMWLFAPSHGRYEPKGEIDSEALPGGDDDEVKLLPSQQSQKQMLAFASGLHYFCGETGFISKTKMLTA